MNIQWIEQFNQDKIQKQNELIEYYNKRASIFIDAIKDAQLVKEKALLNAKIAMLDAFYKNT